MSWRDLEAAGPRTGVGRGELGPSSTLFIKGAGAKADLRFAKRPQRVNRGSRREPTKESKTQLPGGRKTGETPRCSGGTDGKTSGDLG